VGRAPNGQSTIYRGADGRWHTYVTVGKKANGAPDRRHIQRRTAGEVAEAVKQLRERVDRGSGVIGKIETVEQWLTYWLGNVVEPRLRAGTTKQYRSLVEQHLIPSLGEWKLDGNRRRLEPEHVEAVYAKMRRKGLSAAYVHSAHVVLRKALKDAMRRGRTGRNVCDMIDPPAAGRTKISSHTLAEVEAILTAAMQDREPARWLIGMLLGLRQGEVLALRWHRLELDSDAPAMQVATQLQRQRWEHGCDDPHACAVRRCAAKRCVAGFEHGCGGSCGKRLAYACPRRRQTAACVRHKRACPPPCKPGCAKHASSCPQRRGGGLVEVGVKSEKSDREVPLPPVVVEQLRATRERQIRRHVQFGVSWDPRGLVFTSDQLRPVDPRRDHDAWERLLQRAGVQDSRLHAARHSAATYLLATGTDSRVVQKLLGHSRLTVTEVYMDVAKGLKQEAVNRIAATLLDGQLATLLQGPTMKG
jgi:integrase